MSMNERIIALADDVNDLLTKESQIGSQDFIKLASRLMNFSELTLSLERLEQEERKEVEFEWIWKNNIV